MDNLQQCNMKKKKYKNLKKLKKELEALEQAHKSGFISEESYQKNKKRIEDKLNRSS